MKLEPVFTSFDGKKINLSEMDEQLLSNIIHYARHVGKHPFYLENHTLIEKVVQDKLDGKILPYRLSATNTHEVENLFQKKMLMCSMEGRISIVKNGTWIGEIVEDNEPMLLKLKNLLKRD